MTRQFLDIFKFFNVVSRIYHLRVNTSAERQREETSLIIHRPGGFPSGLHPGAELSSDFPRTNGTITPGQFTD